MFRISRILVTGWNFVQYVFEWRRNIRARNGTDDARRARASRLLMLQSCAGSPIGGYPYGLPENLADARNRKRDVWTLGDLE